MTIQVMNRVENKYTVNTYTYLQLIKTIEKYMQPDEYNKNNDFYTISNLYYDTEDNHLIRTSLSKPKYKEKLRLRAYGVPTESDKVFFEIKKKYNGTVNKRRASFELFNAYEFAATYRAPEGSGQIIRELAYALDVYKPKPRVYIAYDRRAYIGENGLRITFDTNIRTRRHDLRLEQGDHGNPLLDIDQWLIETKAEGALPLWLTSLFSEHGVFSSSFSKYGTEYKQYLMNGGTSICSNQYLIWQLMPQPLHSHGKLPVSQLA